MVRPTTVTLEQGGSLEFRRLRGREELGRNFTFEVELLSKADDVDFEKVLGKWMSVELELPDGKSRHFNGLVAQFGHAGANKTHVIYRATLKPWLWMLTHASDCRIFQNMSVPEIIQQVFRDRGYSDFKKSLSGNYAKRDYTVQYRETDFDFVSRLMEQEGIYYYFEHEAKKHTLVLSDGYSAHSPFPGYDEIRFYPQMDGSDRRDIDHINGWSMEENLRTDTVALRDFDFERPTANLHTKLKSLENFSTGLEMYDYPGVYVDAKQGEAYVRTRVEELYALHEVATGAGNAKGVAAGRLFTLTDFPRADQNKEYLVVSSQYEIESDEQETGGGSSGDVFRCRFTTIDSQRPFRPARTTPRPVVRGPQTAMVVGKSGEDLWTDEHGRVKLQFHWDRLGKRDENSSCWVRVAQLWASGKWGAQFLPRIGDEVVVEFLEGDPDRPLVTGRLYNGDNKVPYALPANQTQSGIKSRSSKDGTDKNFNEIRFEDKKGKELLYVQAEKDREIYVKNDETHLVDHDRKKTVKNDETTIVEKNRTETVKANETILIEGERKETVKKDETITIEGERKETVKKDESITIEGKRTEEVAKDEAVKVKGKRDVEIAKDDSLVVKGARKVKVTKDNTVTVNGGNTFKVTKDQKIDAKKITLTGKQQVTLKCGAASITLKASGQIDIKGVQVTVNGSGMTTVKAGGILTLQGSMITEK